MTVDENTFRVVTVCTGNICRSPAAQLLLANALGPSVQVTSMGTGAMVGRPVEPAMAALMGVAGVSVDGFAARQLTAAEVSNADLILCMALEHRAQVVGLVPSAVRRTFTLLEFARLLQAIPAVEVPPAGTSAEALRQLLPTAIRLRSSAARATDVWDVPDPYLQGQGAFEESYALIKSSADAISQVVGQSKSAGNKERLNSVSN